jgi:hypothetical protein
VAISRSIRLAGNVTYIREECIQALVGKPEAKTFGRPRLRWEDNTEMYLKKKNGWVWTGLMGFNSGTSGGSLLGFIKWWQLLGTMHISSSRVTELHEVS